MELEAFISSTIEQVARGILGAREALADTDAVVNPEHLRVNTENSQAYGRATVSGMRPNDSDGTKVVQRMDFDIAVTVEESKSKDVSAKISVLSLGLGAGGESGAKFGSVSRVRFTVPMVLPSGKKPGKNA